MRAIGIINFGGPEALELVDVEEVHAGPGELRIKVRAATVNPTDVMTRNGTRAEQQKIDPPPYVPGMDIAGTVDEVGDGVTGIKSGDAVMAMVVTKASHGGYREQIVSERPIRGIDAGWHIVCRSGDAPDERADGAPVSGFAGSVVGAGGCGHGRSGGVWRLCHPARQSGRAHSHCRCVRG